MMAWIWRGLGLLHWRSAQLGFQYHAMDVLRRESVCGREKECYPGRICVFRARDTWRGRRASVPDDLYWGRVCAEAKVWHIEGDHFSVFDGAHVEATAQAVFDAIKCCKREANGPAARAAGP